MKYKRIYEEFSYGKELVAYECEEGRIDIHYYETTASGNLKKDYVIKAFEGTGKASRFEALKEAKQALENN